MTDEPELEALRADYEKQIFDLKQLLEVSKSLNSTLDYHNLIDAILFTIMGQMRVLKAGLLAKKGLDSTSFSLHRNYKGFEVDHGVDYGVAEDHPLVRLFARTNRCFTLAEAIEGIGGEEGMEGLASLEPSLLVPLKAKGAVNGVILLGERIEEGEFDEAERDYVLTIATFAAIAINNAFLFEMTTTDMMTKLKMKHYFYTMLLERMEEAAADGEPLSVVMMDIDFFKKFNDTYGHSCGDAVLKRVAGTIQGCVRSVDLAARYGGEEFCVLLPGTGKDKALAVAERIRQSVARSATEYEGRSLAVTISLGVAEYDQVRDLSGKSLIDRADRALYEAKQAGRDRVVAAD
jgi:diguanylate cyclase (GGDEF)-like protein